MLWPKRQCIPTMVLGAVFLRSRLDLGVWGFGVRQNQAEHEPLDRAHRGAGLLEIPIIRLEALRGRYEPAEYR